jgi:predicted nucleotidyltransferase
MVICLLPYGTKLSQRFITPYSSEHQVLSRRKKMTLEELAARLKNSDNVLAVAVIGSAGEDKLNPASDYDLLIVLKAMPISITGGVTNLEGRLTDIIFAISQDIERLSRVDNNEITINSIQGAMLRWLKNARIKFDKTGHLELLQERVKNGFSARLPSEGEVYSRLDKASYNLAHTKRMMASEDPDYQIAIDLRLLYQLADLMVDYFFVRGLPWQGEKHAIRYWRLHDPTYLNLFIKCINEKDRLRRIDHYSELASVTMAPIGELWYSGDTRFRLSPDSEMTIGNIRAAEEFWQSLLGTSQQ